jgi:hypothetical protein
MRLASYLLAFTAFLSPLTLSPSPLTAQQHTAPLACNGTYNTVRVSEIKPGMMPKFHEAVAAQKAWYKKTGTPDEISVMRIIERNPDTKVAAYSETQAITTHTRPGNSAAQRPAEDAGYAAFVALYKESSTIKTEYVTCVAK